MDRNNVRHVPKPKELSGKPGSANPLGTTQLCTAVFAVIFAALAEQP